MATKQSRLRVAFISAETEHCLVGGLAEVAKSLPETLQKRGVEVIRFAPLHRVVWQSIGRNLTEVPFSKNPEVLMDGGTISISAFELRGATVPTIYYKDLAVTGEHGGVECAEIQDAFLENSQSSGQVLGGVLITIVSAGFSTKAECIQKGRTLVQSSFLRPGRPSNYLKVIGLESLMLSISRTGISR
jgi:hypothetical protein